jgi:hypothetical protein
MTYFVVSDVVGRAAAAIVAGAIGLVDFSIIGGLVANLAFGLGGYGPQADPRTGAHRMPMATTNPLPTNRDETPGSCPRARAGDPTVTRSCRNQTTARDLGTGTVPES